MDISIASDKWDFNAISLNPSLTIAIINIYPQYIGWNYKTISHHLFEIDKKIYTGLEENKRIRIE